MSYLKRKKISNDWNEWFAGLVDADVSLLISSAGYISLEITTDLLDKPPLLQIKQELQGSVKRRINARAFRYRLHNKPGILKALFKLNGLCRNSVRIVQLRKICLKLNLPFIPPKPLTYENGWFAGFFDGDGTLGYSFKKGWPQLVVSVSNKKAEDCKPFQRIFGGVVRLDRGSNTHKWEIYSKEAILFFCEYLKKYPLRSHKSKRIRLIPQFFKLREIRAYSHSSQTSTYKAWCLLEKNWVYLNEV